MVPSVFHCHKLGTLIPKEPMLQFLSVAVALYVVSDLRALMHHRVLFKSNAEQGPQLSRPYSEDKVQRLVTSL